MSERKRISLSCSVWFCLLFFVGCLPSLKADPPRLWEGGFIKLVDYTTDSLRDMRYGNLKVREALWPLIDAPSLDCSIEGVRSLNVEFPLVESKFACDVVDDLPFFGLAGSSVAQEAEKSYSHGSDARAGDGNQSRHDGGVDVLEVHEMILAGWVGLMLGMLIMMLARRSS